MIISASSDYRPAAERILPPFLFHYIDGGSYTETTLKRNVEDLSQIALRQRVLKNMSALNLETKLFNETLSMPVALGPVRHVCPTWRSAGGASGGAQGYSVYALDRVGLPYRRGDTGY
jgi:isopentenyl diphosphate isomerase/L-lactate dehydrogenase-like FMN-dependent dehydrogenase